MILPDFKAFPRSGRILGIDWGAVRTGVAISDASREFVFTRPAIVIRRGDESMARKIIDLALGENVVGIVMGLPLRVDGSESDTTDAVRRCATEMCTYSDLPICFIDETLSSYSAATDMGLHTMRDAKTKLDSAAARIILENAISVMQRA